MVDRSDMYFLVLMDFSMPSMDGDEATHRILKMYKNLKISKNHRPYIVCVSAYEDDKHEEAARKSGMKGFLTKPVPQ